MQHLKLPLLLRDRIMAFHTLSWEKFKGLDQNEILADLPDTMKNQITENMFKDMIEKSDFFPKNDIGFISSFIKKFRLILVPQHEYVFYKGDIAEELYFIVNGKAVVIDDEDEGNSIILYQSALFGEMGVLDLKSGRRSVKLF